MSDLQHHHRRLEALDVFRGMTIAFMILVNTPGSWDHVYAPLRHASWNGCTPTDLVFPFFLFIVGTAMWFSSRKLNHGLDGSTSRRIVKRVALIFLVGLALNAFPFYRDYSTLRILGVLQRIALAYGAAAFLCLSLTRSQLIKLSGAMLIGYWWLLWAFGGDPPFELETNLVKAVDLAVFGTSHVYHGYGIPFDPEGLLSTIPSIVTVLLGFLAGSLVGQASRMESAVLKLLLGGTSCYAAALIWNSFFPINKPIWSSSYVLYTAGAGMACLAWFLWLIEIKNCRRWARPFTIMGMNPLFAYVLASLLAKTLLLVKWTRSDGSATSAYSALYDSVFAPFAGPLNGSLLFALFHVALVWTVTWILYRKRVVIKV